MSTRNHKPAVVQSRDGRKFKVLGNQITVKLSSAETGGDYHLFDCDVPPGVGVPPHVHSREDEILEVMEGELEIFIGGKTFQATANAVAFFPRHVVHGFTNQAKTSARCRFLASPGANFEKFFDELSALPDQLPPDMGKVAEIFARYGLPIVADPAS